MSYIVENAMLTFAVLLVPLAVGFLVVVFYSFTNGSAAHDENRLLSRGGMSSALHGVLETEVAGSESRSNRGLAINLKSHTLIAQGRLSEEAVDEAIGIKV